jgi:two-component system chemotaxis response regulator CheB
MLNRNEKVNRHRPSVDVLFESAAEVAGARVTGILLTGMGDDGARGLLKIRQKGGRTIAQNASSCVVFGMPKRAIELGAANEILNPSEIVTQLTEIKL